MSLSDYVKAERLRVLKKYPFLSMLPNGQLIQNPADLSWTHDDWKAYVLDTWDAMTVIPEDYGIENNTRPVRRMQQHETA